MGFLDAGSDRGDEVGISEDGCFAFGEDDGGDQCDRSVVGDGREVAVVAAVADLGELNAASIVEFDEGRRGRRCVSHEQKCMRNLSRNVNRVNP